MTLKELIIKHEGLRQLPLALDSVLLRCASCHQRKTTAAFQKSQDRRSGHQSYCNDCRRTKRQARHERRKDEDNARNRAYYYKNKARIRVNQCKYETRQNELARTEKVIHARILFKAIRQRARSRKITFNLEPSDIIIPKLCPVFGCELIRANGHMRPNSATVDRIDPKRGYIKGNVIVVSLRANVIKNDATASELFRVAEFYKALNDGRDKLN